MSRPRSGRSGGHHAAHPALPGLAASHHLQVTEREPRNVGGRPRGEVRQALDAALRELHAEKIGATYIELAHRAKVSRSVAAATLKMMVRYKAVKVVGTVPIEKMPWRGLNLYAPADPVCESPAEALAGVLAGWFSR